jgi:hypothetical protein
MSRYCHAGARWEKGIAASEALSRMTVLHVVVST